ncbi:AAA family ATPase [Lentzea sp. NPDC059081]|uniref:AAA family ATPase n=1 Tax=Lentzea sp. NPDC059081 TaxID=3346719 RepID=UPI003696444C
MPRLIHLNGATGVGKSTIAARYAADHPRTLNLDADEIVRLVGGWRDDFYGTVDLVRPLALAMAATHLGLGNDVVMPQLIAVDSERDRFAAVARAARADYREFVLVAPAETMIDRFHRRGHPIDPAIEAMGGEKLIRRAHAHFGTYITPGTRTIDTAGASVDETYDELLAALSC